MHFLNHDLELAQLNLSQVHDIPSSHMQSLCEVGISKDFPQKKGRPDKIMIMFFQ